MHTYLNTPMHLPRMSNIAEGMGRTARAALQHPFGLTLLIISLTVATAARFLPVPERVADFAPWMLGWGIAAYVASVVAIKRVRPAPSAPELRELYSVRQFMAKELAKRKAARGGEVRELTRVLAEAIDHLDRQVTPELQMLLARHGELSNNLARYESGELPLPEAEVFERIRHIHARQRAAIDECVQQASNAAGTLVALLQEGDEARIAAEAQKWARELLTLYDAIGDVLRGEGEQVVPDEVSRLPAASTAAPCNRREAQESPCFRQLVEDTLRHLNSTSALTQCELACWLPATIAAHRAQCADGSASALTPLEQVQALREVIVSSIELMNPEGNNGRTAAPEALQYHILYKQYVLGTPTRHIMMRYSVAESTYHRYRREAVSVLACHLEAQEEQLRRKGDGSTDRTPLSF